MRSQRPEKALTKIIISWLITSTWQLIMVENFPFAYSLKLSLVVIKYIQYKLLIIYNTIYIAKIDLLYTNKFDMIIHNLYNFYI